MEILDAAKWFNGQLLSICLALFILCLGFALTIRLFILSVKYWKFSLCILITSCIGYGCYKYMEQKNIDKHNRLIEIHEQCFANCSVKNYYLDLFLLQDFHNKVMWNDSTNYGNEKIYKTYFYPEDGSMGGVEVKSSFNKIYYYSCEIFMDDFDVKFFEKNNYTKIEENNTENANDEILTPAQARAYTIRKTDKTMTHLYKKDNIFIKIKLFHNSDYYTCPMCKVEIYDYEMKHLINII